MRYSAKSCLPSLLILAAVVGGGAALADDGVSAARQRELMNLLKHDCGSCHGLTMKGGLGSPLLASGLAGKSAEGLAEVILDGLPNTPMPPWRPLLSEADAIWLARQLKAGGAE